MGRIIIEPKYAPATSSMVSAPVDNDRSRSNRRSSKGRSVFSARRANSASSSAPAPAGAMTAGVRGSP